MSKFFDETMQGLLEAVKLEGKKVDRLTNPLYDIISKEADKRIKNNYNCTEAKFIFYK